MKEATFMHTGLENEKHILSFLAFNHFEDLSTIH